MTARHEKEWFTDDELCNDDKTCPFCRDTGYDLIGLKLHLSLGHCDAWNEVPNETPKSKRVRP